MSIIIPQPLLGVNCSATWTPGTVDPTTGVLTPGTAQSLAFQLEEMNISMDTTTEEINSMDRAAQNTVIVTHGTTITFTEILKAGGTNHLAAIANSNTYGQWVIARGAQDWTGVGIATNYVEGLKRGKSTGILKISPVDSGGTAANPIYG